MFRRTARRREKRYRHSPKSTRRAQTVNGKPNEGVIEAKLKESTSPLSPEDVPDSIAVAQHLISETQDTQDVEVFLQARKTVDSDGKIELKIISVFQVAKPFQSTLPRYFHMRKEVVDGGRVAVYPYGLAQTGPFIPLSPGQQSKYGTVKMSGEESEIIISNDVDDNKLYLRIQKRKRGITVARNPGKNSMFDVKRLSNGYYVFKTVAIPGYALKYTNTKRIIVAEYKPVDSDFQFMLEPPTPSESSTFCFVY